MDFNYLSSTDSSFYRLFASSRRCYNQVVEKLIVKPAKYYREKPNERSRRANE